jgi:hypothetical protein
VWRNLVRRTGLKIQRAYAHAGSNPATRIMDDRQFEDLKTELEKLASKIAGYKMEWIMARKRRDEIITELIDSNRLSWRQVAVLASIHNPYIAQILKRNRVSGED